MAVSHGRPIKRTGTPNKKKKQQGGGGGLIVLTFFLVVPASIFMLPMTVITCLGMIPTVVAFIADRSADKLAPVTVGAMNVCGVLPFAIEFLDGSQGIERLGGVLGEPTTWLVMYGAAAVGWSLYFAIPTMVGSFEVLRGQGRIDHLERKKRRLIEEWGGAVADSGETDGLPEPGDAPKPPETGKPGTVRTRAAAAR